MSEQKNALQTARAKVASLLEIYAPMNAARKNALASMGAALVEFEAAVREDERAAVQAASDAAALDEAVTPPAPPAPVEPVVHDPSDAPAPLPAEPTGDGMPEEGLAPLNYMPDLANGGPVVELAAPLQAAPVVDPATVAPATEEKKKGRSRNK